MTVLIKKGIREILEGKDPDWAGSRANFIDSLKNSAEFFAAQMVAGFVDKALGGVNAAINSAVDSATDYLYDVVNPGRGKNAQLKPLGDPDDDSGGGGIHEYGLYRDKTKSDELSPTAAEAQAEAADRLWDVDIREFTGRLNSVLEERSYLDFYFPNDLMDPGAGETNRILRGKRRVAFFENPNIREDRMARYATQAIVARNEPARLYVGSEARKIKLDFTFTLPHVSYFFSMCYKDALDGFDFLGRFNQSFYTEYTLNHLDKFFGSDYKTSPTDTDTNTVFFENKERTKGPRLYNPHNQNPIDGFKFAKPAINLGGELHQMAAVGQNPEYLQFKLNPDMHATYYTQFVIDTIRAAVVGDTTDIGPQGPPIVRFRHGSIFRENPFIVKSYSITYPTDKGYEFRTLTPRQVKFSLSLEEFHQTHGSHHGDITSQVPDGLDILSLNTLNES